MMRMGVPVLVSLTLSTLGILYAYHQRRQFYPAAIYIVKSNLLMSIMYFQILVFVILFGNLMKKIFFGTLRASEFENLVERSWYAVLETFLTFAIFKDNFSDKFVAFFSILLFLKIFHWLGEIRVNLMEQSPTNSALFDLRIFSLTVILGFLDLQLISYAYSATQQEGDSVQLVFGFEYAVLFTVVNNFFFKYILHSADLRSETPWHDKPIYMLYLELFVGFVKVVLYSLFILITLRIYTIPLFAIRPMYLNLRALKNTLVGIVSSRQAIHIMDAYYSEATTEQLASADSLCTICRDEMVADSTKILPCNHIFHKSCLRSWFQRQQTCPTCRLDVIRNFRRQRNPQQQPQQQQQQAVQQAQPPANTPAPAGQQQPQQPPQPNQQPFVPQFPGFNPNMFAQMMAGAPQFPFPPPPHPNQPASSENEAAGASSAENASASSSNAGSSAPPFSMPPLHFPPPPPPLFTYFTPPPMPPTNFKGLSDEELSAMEGTERKNVEARIECLKNIQVLLDAAVLEMQQYASVISRIDHNQTSTETGARPKQSEPKSNDGENEIIEKMDKDINHLSAAESSLEQEEVRRRRLERFTNISSNSP